MSHIKDRNLAEAGQRRYEWAYRDMPVLASIRERFLKERPLKDVRIAACLHITTETAALLLTLKDGGASVAACASNPLSTQDDVAAFLDSQGIETFAIKGEDNKTYYEHIAQVLNSKPQFTMDDGADLVHQLHTARRELLPLVKAGTEETTTGVIRLRAMEREGALAYPIIAVNDSLTKHLFDNRYGTGQSTIDGILRATNRLLCGSCFVVAGYGWCGRGVAQRARGMGARTIVTEVDPLRALEALMDGFEVMSMEEAAPLGDIFCTLTGNTSVLREEHFSKMKDGAILCNSGHFNNEINLDALAKLSTTRRVLKDFVEEFVLKNGTRICVLAEGRLVNLSTAEGHPAAVMDMSFANQALAAEHFLKSGQSVPVGVHSLPKSVDTEIARLKLAAMGVNLDALTADQKVYLDSWKFGT